MMTSVMAIMLLMLALTAASSASFTDCRHNITKVRNIWNCSDTFRLDFPQKETIPVGVDTYDLSHKRILELHRINSTCGNVHSCKGCLRNLYLHHNDIDNIDNNAFLNLHCLHTLDLSYNKIRGESLTSMTFDGLLQLEVLSLKGNPVIQLKDFTLRFNELRILRTLDLSDCQLTSIGQHAFDDLSLLEKLDLSGNQLQIVDSRSFRGLSFLEELDLSRNHFSQIQKENFLALIVLKKLYLDDNAIENLPGEAFTGIENLEVLSLSDNWFKGIPYNALKVLQSLRVLNISGNNIRRLKTSDWPKDISLGVKELYIDEDKDLKSIGKHAFASFPLLRKVSLSGNGQLDSIAQDAFQRSSLHIQEVYMNNNRLEYLPQSLLPWDDLKVLQLSGNPWNCDCRLKWMLENDYFRNRVISCNEPRRLHGKNLLMLAPHELRCSRPEVWIPIVCVFSIIIIFIVLVVVVEWKFRDRLPWHRSKEESKCSMISENDDIRFKC